MTRLQPGTLEALAEVIAQRVRAAHGNKPQIRAVSRTDPRTRDNSHLQAQYARQRKLRIIYRIQGLVPQASFHITVASPLSDHQLSRLQADLERTPGCHVEGIVYEISGSMRECTTETASGLQVAM